MGCRKKRSNGIWICASMAACRTRDLGWELSGRWRGFAGWSMCGRRFRFRGCCIDSIRSQTDSPPSTPRAPRNAELDCDGLLEYVIRWREFTAEYAGRREMREKG